MDVDFGAEYPLDAILYNYEKCVHLLAVKYDLDKITVSHEELQKRPMSVWRYKEFLPFVNSGKISAVYKGLCEWRDVGYIDTLTMMTAIHAKGAMPVVNAIKGNLPEVVVEQNPETVASAICIGAPVSAEKVLREIRETRGTAEFVTDADILAMPCDIARYEGIGVEPASAVLLPATS